MTKRFVAVLLSLVMLAMAGCAKGTDKGDGSGKDSGTPVEGGTLNLSMFSAPDGLFNPILSQTLYDSNINTLVFNGLLRTNGSLEWVCDLCETFEISEDNKTVTFKLRKEVKWHDGKPFTTADVAFTFRAMLHPDYEGVRTGDYSALVGVEKMLDERDSLAAQLKDKKITDAEMAKKRAESWEAWLAGDGKKAINVIDTHTISFSTEEPYAPFLQNLAFSIIPAHIFADADISKLTQHPATKQQPIGTGPYRFKEYRTDQYVMLERYEGYHLGKPFIPTIIYKIVNQEVAIGQLKNGELDFIPITPANAELVEGDANVEIFERPAFGYQYMGLNHDHWILKDQAVRQALMHGINRQAIVDQLLKGHGTIMNSHMPPALWAYDAASLNAYKYDVAKAKELLTKAGWTEKNSEGYLTKDGKVFEFTLKYPSGNKVREQSAPLIQANLKELGIKVNLVQLEFSTLAEDVFDKRAMDAWLMGWSLSIDPDPGAIFLPDNKWGKVTGWTNERNNKLIKDGTRVLKVTERKPIYVEWAKILNDELPYVFLYSQNDMDAVRTDRIKGLRADARGTLWNIHELWIPAEKQ